MEHLIKEHGPAGLVALSLALTGGFINYEPNQNATLEMQPQWCNKTLQLNNTLPPSLLPLAVITSLVLPMVPLFLNSKTHWTDMKTEVTKAHLVGQSVSFGTSELLRHFVIIPENSFLQKCNLSQEECFSNLGTNLSLTGLCPKPSQPNLFDSLHHFPEATCTSLGASFISFAASLAYWHYINKVEKSVYQSSAYTKMALITLQCLLVIVLVIYCIYLYKSLEVAHFLSLLLGGSLQLFVILSMLRQKQIDFVMTPEESKPENKSIIKL